MKISNSAGIQAAAKAVENVGTGVAAALVLSKALSANGAVMQTLAQAVPAAVPVLAVTGAIGTLINTLA